MDLPASCLDTLSGGSYLNEKDIEMMETLIDYDVEEFELNSRSEKITDLFV